MMKRIISTLAVTVAVMAALASCAPSPFDPASAVSDALKTEIKQNNATARNSASTINVAVSATALTIQPTSAGTPQVITLTVNNGIMDLSGTSLPGVTVYALESPTVATAVYNRKVALAYTAKVEQTAGGSFAYLSLPLNETTVSAKIEVVVDPATATFDAGLRKLDQDGDKRPGEAEEDLVISYVAVNSNLAVTPNVNVVALGSGVNRSGPNAALIAAPTVNLGNLNTVGNTTFTITLTDTDSVNTNFSASEIAAAVEMQKFNQTTRVWEPVTITSSAFATGTYTATIGATVYANLYRVRLNNYKVIEAAAVRGYKHRVSNDQSSYSAWQYQGTGGTNGTSDVTGLTFGGVYGAYYLDVTTDAVALDYSTVLPANMRVIHKDGGAGARYTEVTGFTITRVDTNKSKFRILLPASFEKFTVAGRTVTVYVYAAVLDNNNTSTTTADDKAFANASEFGAADGTVNNY